jgi:hypothetical protein
MCDRGEIFTRENLPLKNQAVYTGKNLQNSVQCKTYLFSYSQISITLKIHFNAKLSDFQKKKTKKKKHSSAS